MKYYLFNIIKLTLFFLFIKNSLNAQITVEQDILFPSKSRIINFANGGNPVKIELTNNESAFISKKRTKVCIKKIINCFDSIAEVVLYNDFGNIENKFLIPNLDKIKLSDDGKIAVYGSYFSNEIMLPTNLFLFDRNGNIKYNTKKEMGFEPYCEFTTDGKYFIYVVDSFNNDLMNKKYTVIVFDENYSVFGKRILNVNKKENLFQFSFIDEINKIVIFKMILIKSLDIKILKIKFNGDLLY